MSNNYHFFHKLEEIIHFQERFLQAYSGVLIADNTCHVLTFNFAWRCANSDKSSSSLSSIPYLVKCLTYKMKWISIKTNEQKATIDTTICNMASHWFSPVSAIFNGNKIW
jgi:hypothetical protein